MSSEQKTTDWRAEYEGEDVDAAWTTEGLRKARDYLKEIDVCGAMDECPEVCPCGLLRSAGDE